MCEGPGGAEEGAADHGVADRGAQLKDEGEQAADEGVLNEQLGGRGPSVDEGIRRPDGDAGGCDQEPARRCGGSAEDAELQEALPEEGGEAEGRGVEGHGAAQLGPVADVLVAVEVDPGQGDRAGDRGEDGGHEAEVDRDPSAGVEAVGEVDAAEDGGGGEEGGHPGGQADPGADVVVEIHLGRALKKGVGRGGGEQGEERDPTGGGDRDRVIRGGRGLLAHERLVGGEERECPLTRRGELIH